MNIEEKLKEIQPIRFKPFLVFSKGIFFTVKAINNNYSFIRTLTLENTEGITVVVPLSVINVKFDDKVKMLMYINILMM